VYREHQMEVSMELIEIEGTSLRVSRVALGTWAIGGWLWGGTEEGESIRTIHAALDRGVNLIDTAPVYGFGLSEQIVGKALTEKGQRDRVFIATKTGLAWKEGKVFRNSDPDYIRRNVEESLGNLRTDHIDILFIHWPDPLVPFEETGQVMSELLKEGKIRTVGVSNYSSEQMEGFRSGGPLHVSQPPYNIFERGVEEGHMEYCKKHGVSLMTYGALCRGLLSGKMNAESTFQGDDIRNLDPKFKVPRFGQYLTAVERLGAFSRERFGRGIIPFALRWILDKGAEIAIWGGRRPEQMEPLGEVSAWHVDDEAMAAVDKILKETIADPLGPEFMGPPDREGKKPS
jgi:aryl-alcohol dehydrogenase-like predicted oxidoreductase